MRIEEQQPANPRAGTPASPAAPPPATHSRVDLALRLFVPFLFLLVFAGDLLKTYFSEDDFMNLYKYLESGWSVCRGLVVFWSSTYTRPMGGLAYLSLYHAFGFHPEPFKILVLLLLLFNLALTLFLIATLFRSPALAALGGILIAYHGAETQLYYSFGTIYDITCFTFMYLAVALFVHVREQEKIPGPRLVLLLALLQIAALDCKEMAVSLPLLILLYEAFASPLARRRDFDPHAWITPIFLGVLVLCYVGGKATGDATITQNLLYRPELTAHKYLQSMSRYLDVIFYRNQVFGPKIAVALICTGLALALLLRSRFLFLGWSWFLVSLLPLNFIADRSGFVLYIPLVGLAVAFVALLRDGFLLLPKTFRSSQVGKLASPDGLLLFLLLALLLFRYDRAQKRYADPIEKRPLSLNQQFAADLAQAAPNPKPHAHLLFLNDPFPDDSWSTVFLPALQRHDMGLSAARARRNFLALATPLLPQYDETYAYSEPHLTRLTGPELTARLAALRTTEGFIEPGDGIWIQAGPYEWTRRSFTLRAGCPAGKAECHLVDDFFLPTPAYATTPVHHLTVKVDNGAATVATLTTDRPSILVSMPLDGRVPSHLVTYEFDAIVPPAQHPNDPRELGLVLHGAMIEP